MKLEELARKSSDAARASVVHLDPPPIDQRSVRRSWHIPAFAGALAMGAAVIFGAVAIVGGDDDIDPTDTVLAAPADVPRLGLATLDEWTISGVADLSDVTGGGVQSSAWSYYGTAGADDPFADGDLVTIVLSGASPDSVPTSDESVMVRGFEAAIYHGAEAGLPAGATIIQWFEPAAGDITQDSMMALASATLDGAQLTELAATIEVTASGSGRATISLPADTDIDLDVLVENSPGPSLSVPSVASEGWIVAYTGVTTEAENLIIMTRPGAVANQRTAGYWWSESVADATVDNTAGFTMGIVDGSTGEPIGSTLTWSSAPGVVTSITHVGPNAIDLTTMAESLVEIDDATWDRYETLAQSPTVDVASFDEIFGEGNGVVGEVTYTWVLGLRDGDLCFDFGTESEGMGSCQALVDGTSLAGTAQSIDNSFGPTSVNVLIAADPAVDFVVEATGIGSIERVNTPTTSYFVYVGAPDVQPSFEVVAADGTRTSVEAGTVAVEEAMVDAPPFDIADNASAQELGIVDDLVLLGSGSNRDLEWALGTVGNDICLITSGTAETASCSPSADITILKPIQLDDASEVTFIITTNQPSCVGLDEIGGADPTYTSSATGDLTLHQVAGTSDGWSLELIDPDFQITSVPLPNVEGSVSWPAGLCP